MFVHDLNRALRPQRGDSELPIRQRRDRDRRENRDPFDQGPLGGEHFNDIGPPVRDQHIASRIQIKIRRVDDGIFGGGSGRNLTNERGVLIVDPDDVRRFGEHVVAPNRIALHDGDAGQAAGAKGDRTGIKHATNRLRVRAPAETEKAHPGQD